MEEKGSVLPASLNPPAESHLAPGGIPSGEVTSWREGEQENPASFHSMDGYSFCNRGAPSRLIPLDGAAQRAPSTSILRGWSCCHGKACLDGLQTFS